MENCKESWIGDLHQRTDIRAILTLLNNGGTMADIDLFNISFPKGKKSQVRVWLLYENQKLIAWSVADNSDVMNYGIGKKQGETGIYVFVAPIQRGKGYGKLLANKAIEFARLNDWNPKGFAHSVSGRLFYANLGI